MFEHNENEKKIKYGHEYTGGAFFRPPSNHHHSGPVELELKTSVDEE